MDKFERQIFLGNGDHSLACIGQLYVLLGQAIAHLGNLQQPGNTDGESQMSEYRLKRTADEIYVALTGKNPKD
jgi:hypothetical protein